MKLQTLAKVAVVLSAFGVCSLAIADVVVTKSGARLLGTVTKIDGDHVVLKTDYAGIVAIDQREVASIETEKPITVRLVGGTTMAGTISTTPEGQVAIAGSDGTITTSVDKVAMTWAPGASDPAIEEGRRNWSYQAAVDITGKSGNSEQLGTAASARAVLAGPNDKLQFYTAYNRQKSDGVTSSDQFKAGIDYSNTYAGRNSWYVRTEGGFDRVKDVDLYNVSAAGLGYAFIKNDRQTLTGRAGLSYRYEGYGAIGEEDLSSAGLDLGLLHTYEFGDARMQNAITFVPAFDDFANYQVVHDSFFEMPITAALWALRIGVSNDYTSMPSAGREELDTTYYTRLVLNWK